MSDLVSYNKENDSAPEKKGARKSAGKNSTNTELDNTLTIKEFIKPHLACENRCMHWYWGR